MRLDSVALKNFRNYKQSEVALNADLVLILGENASGKTNFLESIYFLSILRSFRAPDQMLVKNQEGYFNILGNYGEKELEAIIQIDPAVKRQFKINGQKTNRALWQTFPVVLFVPNDLNLFHLGPSQRRKFLDDILIQNDPNYAVDLISLEHILKQKSALLEQIYLGQGSREQLGFWNQQLAEVGARITLKRQKFIDFLNSRLNEILKNLTGFSDQFLTQYKKFGEIITPTDLLENLTQHEEAEVRSGQNLVGPHRDDFTIEKNGELNLYNSSRGELRAQILALKLLQAEYLSVGDKKPIILLDDVFSELDETRRSKLIETLSGHQIFITSTEEHHLPKIASSALVLKVANNEIN